MTWFNKQSRLVQLILLLIPGVNWITEIVVRWSTFFKRGGRSEIDNLSRGHGRRSFCRLVGSYLGSAFQKAFPSVISN